MAYPNNWTPVTIELHVMIQIYCDVAAGVVIGAIMA